MSNHKLKKNVFEAIRKELLDTTRNRTQADIAADYQVTSTMVSVVNNARSWGNYLLGKKASHPLRSPVKAVKPTKVEKAQKAGLNPRTRDDRFEQELKKIDEKYATKEDLKDSIDASHERISAISKLSGRSSADAITLGAQARSTARAALVVSSVSLVLSLIALAN